MLFQLRCRFCKGDFYGEFETSLAYELTFDPCMQQYKQTMVDCKEATSLSIRKLVPHMMAISPTDGDLGAVVLIVGYLEVDATELWRCRVVEGCEEVARPGPPLRCCAQPPHLKHET